MKVLGVVGWKNAGKTALVERLVAEFTARGLTVSTLKHAHHAFEVDHEGRDSFRHRAAGARQVLVSSAARWALMTELRGDAEPDLNALLARFDPVDLVIVEGFKQADIPRIEVHRAETGHPLIAAEDDGILAVAGDAAAGLACPVLPLDDTAAIADFLDRALGLTGAAAPADGSGACFALPPGVDWIAVDTALEGLRDRFSAVAGIEEVPLGTALGRILAEDVAARRASPPLANSAVDGYGFSASSAPEAGLPMPLVPGRAAPGAPLGDPVPPGQAVRILTGGPLPDGVDTVVLQEQARVTGGAVVLTELPRRGANTRPAGEDARPGQVVLHAGQVLRPQDLGLAASVGLSSLPVRRPLRIAVLSTGSELVADGQAADPAAIFDANRPMLLGLVRDWGHLPIDLGQVGDDAAALRRRLDDGAERADLILTSGGASAGDEDHVATLLRRHGALDQWRIAVKPGRPLALGRWRDVPVFGLPGNPVAAFVCALVFARPVLMRLAGAPWPQPRPVMLPAAFTKRKKAGRREFLRARVGGDGRVEVFPSEGSGRVSGLSWATGLVDLPEDAADIRPGRPVAFVPFSEFGLRGGFAV